MLFPHIPTNFQLVLQPSSDFSDLFRHLQVPQTRITRTGRVHELVIPKVPKTSDPIRGLGSQSAPFDVVNEIFNHPVNITAA